MSHWTETKLKDLCERITVGYVGPMAHAYRETGIPFLRSQNVKPGRLDFEGIKYIDDAFHAKISKSALLPGDVAIVRTGYPGTAAVVPPSLAISNCSDLVLVRPGKNLNAHFVAAIFNSVFGQTLVSGNTVGAAQQHFNVTTAKELRLRIPPKPIQDKIAAVLAAYDDLIEANRRRIALLERMAEEIYREWFVRLRFPGHATTKISKGIPAGWDIRPFSDVVETNPTERIDKEEERPFVAMEELSESSMYFTHHERRKGHVGPKFRNGDVLFPRITPSVENGKRGLVMTLADGEVAQGSTEFIVLREKVLTTEHIYFLSVSEGFRTNAELSMTGASGRQRVQEQCFTQFLVKTPPPALREKFTAIVRPMVTQIRLLSIQTEALTRTRDLLLPRLISGKLPVEARPIAFPPSMAAEPAA
jgi:type I restriction enzyme S subunit